MTTTLREILGDRTVLTVSPDAGMREAATLLAEHRVGAVAVVEDEKLVGILSERDIVFRGVAHGDDLSVSELMTKSPVTVDIDDAISDTLAAKLGDAFRHLPVLENGKLVGLLSYRDIPAEYVMMYERFREMSAAHADD